MLFIRMKGLPWHSTEEDVLGFFTQLPIEKEWVHLIRMPDGRDSGECLVGVKSEAEYQLCMGFDKNFMGKRYIELYKATEEEWSRITTRTHRVNSVPIDPNSFVVLMRGLPYSAQEDDCISFFKGCACLGVHLTKDRYGRPSGQGYAEFASEENYNQAMELDRSNMQNRYIELFQSNVSELVNAVNNCNNREQNKNNRQGGRRNQQPQTPGRYHKGKSQSRYYLQMIGLPLGSSEDDLKLFFNAQDLSPLRAHMKSDGSEAFVEFGTLEDSERALTLSHSQIDDTVIEIFKSSYKKMRQKMGNQMQGGGRKNNYPNKRNYHNNQMTFQGRQGGFQDGPTLYQFGDQRPGNPGTFNNQLILPNSFTPPSQSPTNFVAPISPGQGFSPNAQNPYQFAPGNLPPYIQQTFPQQTSIVGGVNPNESQGVQGNQLPFPVYSPSPNNNPLIPSFNFPLQYNPPSPASALPNPPRSSQPGQTQTQPSYTYTPRR